MDVIMAWALLAAAPAAQAAPPQEATVAEQDQAQIDRAARLIEGGKPAEAIAILDPLLAAQEQRPAGDWDRRYCARSETETLFYLGSAAHEKKRVVVAAQSACYSAYLKAFALIDLNRSDEAKAYLDRAVAMAPSNAQFLSELGEWHSKRHDWPAALAKFKEAEEAAHFSPPDAEMSERNRALRGQAFVLVEPGKLGEAEALYRKCLKLDPKDERARRELNWVVEQRRKTA